MRYELIDARDAPPKPAAPPSKRTELLTRIISDLSWGKVARIELEGTETVRGTKTSLSRLAKRLGTPIAAWDADNVVFVELSQSMQTRRRGRPPKST